MPGDWFLTALSIAAAQAFLGIVHCQVTGRVGNLPAAAGMAIRRSLMEGSARATGSNLIEVPPIERDLHRYSRMSG